MNAQIPVAHLTAQDALPAPVMPIPLADLHPSPTNPRRTFAPGPLAEMADSIRRLGVLQPILVRPWPAGYHSISTTAVYEIVAGERRYRASLLAEMPTIMATVRPLRDSEVLEVQILENLQREEVHPLEEAEGYQVLMLRTNYTVETLSAKLGKSRAYIYARLKLCAITGEAREAFRAGQITASVALLIARIPVPALQQEALAKIFTGHGFGGEPMTARQAADYVQQKYMLKLADAPFPRQDAKLLDGAPTCAKCPKRTGNDKEAFPDVKNADVCTDPVCFGQKREAHKARQAEEAERAGKRVITGEDARKVAPYGHTTYEMKIGQGLAWLDATVMGAKADAQGKMPTWREMLGPDCPVTAVVEDTRTHRLHDAAKLDELRAAAKARGIDLGSQRGSSATEADREREKIAREQTALRRALVERIIERSDGQMLDLDELRAAAARMFERLDFETQKLAVRMWGNDGKIERSDTDALCGDILSMSGDDVNRMLRLLTFVGRIHVNAWSSKPTDIPPEILDACAYWEVDVPGLKAKLAGGGKKPVPRYRHPNNGMTWSGRGKQPVWVKEWLEAGNTLDELVQP